MCSARRRISKPKSAASVRCCGLSMRTLVSPSFKVALATRPAMRAGNDQTWDRAEEALANAARAAGLEFDVLEGEGAFYGPKLEFHLTDSRERSWQCGTIQLDFVLPERLDAEFVNERNERERPVMIHHAVLGSMERFIAMLLEHHEGWLPVWLAPEQVVVATISDANAAYAQEVMQALEDAGIRALLDSRPERLGEEDRRRTGKAGADFRRSRFAR